MRSIWFDRVRVSRHKYYLMGRVLSTWRRNGRVFESVIVQRGEVNNSIPPVHLSVCSVLTEPCLRVPWFEDQADAQRVEIPFRTQYAIRVRCDVPVICQYGRLEVIPNHMLYTTMGYVKQPEEEKRRGKRNATSWKNGCPHRSE